MEYVKQYVILFVLCLGFAGCGGDDAKSPTGTVNAYHQAIMDMDMEGIQAVVAPNTDIGKIKALLEFRSKSIKKFGLPPVVSETIKGDTAVVRCKFGPMEQDVDLIKVDGVWKIQ